MDVAGWIVVPLVSAVGDGSDRGIDRLSAANIVERTPNRFGDERAARSSLDPLIEIGHEVIVERNVQTHGHRLAHSVRFELRSVVYVVVYVVVYDQ